MNYELHNILKFRNFEIKRKRWILVIPCFFFLGFAFYQIVHKNSKVELFIEPDLTLREKFHQFQPYPRQEPVVKQRIETQVSIAIVVMVLDEENNENYRLAVNSIRCYAEVQNYTYIYIDYSKNETLQRMCPQKDFLFARHCVMIDLMKREQFEFFLFFGADNGVINPLRRIEEYLPENPFVNILFYQRFYNDEIMADSYLIRNTQQSLDFLQLWVDYYDRTKNFECSGTDNGAIQSVVIEFFAPEFNASMAICKREWSRGSKYAHLFRYEACAQYLLSLLPESELNKRGFHLFQKGQGWSRDGWVTATKWCQRDLFFHGWKKEKLGSEWELPFSSWNRFDQKCEKGEFSRWRYRSEFKVPCLEIDFRLHQYFSEKRLLYYKALQEMYEKNLFPIEIYNKFGF